MSLTHPKTINISFLRIFFVVNLKYATYGKKKPTTIIYVILHR